MELQSWTWLSNCACIHILLSIVSAPIYIPNSSSQDSLFSTFLLILWFLVFLILAILRAMKWHLMVLICISLIIRDVGHLCMYWLVFSFGKKCLFRTPAIFLIWISFFCNWIMWVLYIFWILTPYLSYKMHIFSLIQDVAFHFVRFFFAMQSF